MFLINAGIRESSAFFGILATQNKLCGPFLRKNLVIDKLLLKF